MDHKLHCPACRQKENVGLGEKNNFSIHRCLGCGTLYTIETAGSSAFDYSNYYGEKNLEIPEFVYERLGEIVRSFEKYRRNNRFLDVGCGAGTLLSVALKENWNAEGVEVSQPSVDFLRSKGIKVFHGDLASADFEDNSFDVVTSVETLEHISAPENILKEVYRILRPGGLFWGTTPHGNGASARLLGTDWTCIAPPEHLHLFSVKGIRKLMAEHGFRNIKILTEGVNPAEIKNNFRFSKKEKINDNENFKPVETAYEINARFSGSKSGRIIKSTVNKVLNLTKLGDSLKIWAEK